MAKELPKLALSHVIRQLTKVHDDTTSLGVKLTQGKEPFNMQKDIYPLMGDIRSAIEWLEAIQKEHN